MKKRWRRHGDLFSGSIDDAFIAFEERTSMPIALVRRGVITNTPLGEERDFIMVSGMETFTAACVDLIKQYEDHCEYEQCTHWLEEAGGA